MLYCNGLCQWLPEGPEGVGSEIRRVKSPEGVCSMAEMPRLKAKYVNEVRTQLNDEFNYPNVNMIPKLTKIVEIGRASCRERV